MILYYHFGIRVFLSCAGMLAHGLHAGDDWNLGTGSLPNYTYLQYITSILSK